MVVNQNPIEQDTSSKLLIKQVARRLFAERGVHDVSVREIAHAARQKNLGVVAYYFTTKDGLIREILIDGAERIEDRRRMSFGATSRQSWLEIFCSAEPSN